MLDKIRKDIEFSFAVQAEYARLRRDAQANGTLKMLGFDPDPLFQEAHDKVKSSVYFAEIS